MKASRLLNVAAVLLQSIEIVFAAVAIAVAAVTCVCSLNNFRL